MFRTRLPALLGACALAAAGLVVATPAANAAAVDATCLGTTQATYDPGLRLRRQTVTFTAHDAYTNCTSSDPTLHNGMAGGAGTLELSCADLFSSGFASGDSITWNNGHTSTFAGTFTLTSAGGLLIDTFNGVVTAGEFQGDSAKLVFTEAQPNFLQCAFPPGVTQETGTLTLLITAG